MRFYYATAIIDMNHLNKAIIEVANHGGEIVQMFEPTFNRCRVMFKFKSESRFNQYNLPDLEYVLWLVDD